MLFKIFRYVGNLDSSVTEEFVTTLFGQIGLVTKTKVICDVIYCIKNIFNNFYLIYSLLTPTIHTLSLSLLIIILLHKHFKQ